MVESVQFCMNDCNTNFKCEALTYNTGTNECTLKQTADAEWNKLKGSQSAYKCNHVSYPSPGKDPDFYLWNSCASRIAQLDDEVVGVYIPQCMDNGGYESEQCHGSTGYCWCVDSFGTEVTKPIFGPVPDGCLGEDVNT